MNSIANKLDKISYLRKELQDLFKEKLIEILNKKGLPINGVKIDYSVVEVYLDYNKKEFNVIITHERGETNLFYNYEDVLLVFKEESSCAETHENILLEYFKDIYKMQGGEM